MKDAVSVNWYAEVNQTYEVNYIHYRSKVLGQ